ncbi:hypothetical protein ABPG74_011976 [Tetrahymena malaccensis]
MKRALLLLAKSPSINSRTSNSFKLGYNCNQFKKFDLFNKSCFQFSSSSGYEAFKQIYEVEKQFQEAIYSKNYEKSVQLLEEKIKLKISYPNSSLLNDYRMLGEINQHLGKGQEALNAYEQALKFSIKLESKEVQALSLADIAGIYYLSENYQQAVGYFEESIALLKQVKGEFHQDVGMGLLNLGESLVKNQDGNKAIQVYEEAKNVYNKLLENNQLNQNAVFEFNRNKGLACDALGSLKLQVGNFQESLEDLQTALGIYGQQFGPEDPILVGTLTNLAILYQSFRKEDDALKIYQRALRIVDANQNRIQPHEYLSLMLGCAKSYNNLGRFREAVEMFDKLENATKEFQKNNQSLLPMIKGHKGFLLIQLEQFDLAKEQIQEGLKILENAEFNIYKAILQTQLAHILLLREQQFQKSFELAKESYDYISKLRKDDANCGDCLRIMGLATSALGNKEEARKYLAQSLQILEKSGDRSDDVNKVKQDLENISK